MREEIEYFKKIKSESKIESKIKWIRNTLVGFLEL